MQEKEFQKANTLYILSENCLNHRSPLAGCHICETACPQNALVYHDRKWQAQNCTLCGICAMVCPSQVFHIDLLNLLSLPSQDLKLCCSQNTTAPEATRRINCIQQLTPLSIIHLLYRHATVTIYLPMEKCKQCTHQWYAQGLVQQLDAYHLPTNKFQIIFDDSPVTTEENTRRELLRDLWHRTENTSKKMLTSTIEKIRAEFDSQEVEQDNPAIFPIRLPLYALYAKKALSLPIDQTLPFRQLHCKSCTFCGACAHLCPTQALKISKNENEIQFFFQPELCINCNLCTQICMQHGLYWGDFMSAEQFMQSPFPLANSIEKICSRCQHEFFQWPPLQDCENPICTFCK